MSIKPALRTDKIVALFLKKGHDGQLSEIEEAQIKRELRSIGKADPALGQSLSAYALALDGEFQQSFALHQVVIEEFPTAGFLWNYAMSLSLAAEHEKAFRMFVKAWEVEPTDAECLTQAIAAGCCTHFSEEVETLKASYKKLTGNEFPSDMVEGIMMEHQFTDDSGFILSASAGLFKDWEREEEENAWRHLQ